jgi:hypothetical protein
MLLIVAIIVAAASVLFLCVFFRSEFCCAFMIFWLLTGTESLHDFLSADPWVLP